MAEERKRHFMLSENVSQSSVKSIIEEIRAINREDDKEEKSKKEFTREPIEILVNTFGGSVYDGFALISAIEGSKTPVHTHCPGKAMSMGFAIMAAGHTRSMSPIATLMYHECSAGVWDKLEGIKQEVEEMTRLQETYDGYVLKRTNIMKEKLEEVKAGRGEWYVAADDAKKLGIVDEIKW